ncbi:MAG: acylphosphatase [Methylohalobius sp.]|nr:acylphosphatase [Methylohalobius sp.]
MRKRWHLWVAGRVQGVFYRANTAEVARRLGLVGWVKNLPDGRVEIVAEGKEENLQEFLVWCRQGPPAAQVTEVEVKEESYTGEFSQFFIKR